LGTGLGTIYHGYEWWAYFFRVRHRELIPGIEQYDRELVRFAWDVLGLSPGDAVLDAGCGGGTQALEFARLGARVTGVDFVPGLVRYAKELARAARLDARFVATDLMRYRAEDCYDAIVLLSSTFGLLVDGPAYLKQAVSMLKPGGAVLIESANPDTYGLDVPATEVDVDDVRLTFYTRFSPETSVLGTFFHVVDEKGRTIRLRRNPAEPDESVRLYNAARMRELLIESGCADVSFFGDVALPPPPLEKASPKLIAVGRK